MDKTCGPNNIPVISHPKIEGSFTLDTSFPTKIAATIATNNQKIDSNICLSLLCYSKKHKVYPLWQHLFMMLYQLIKIIAFNRLITKIFIISILKKI